MLTIHNDELYDTEKQEALLPFAAEEISDFEYDCEVPKGMLYRVRIDLPGSDFEERKREYLYTDDVKETKEAYYINGEYVDKQHCSVCKCTHCKDINGRLLYEKDYVRTNELMWCGFVFLGDKDDSDLIAKHPLSVIGSGGFSYLPTALEWIASPIFNEYREPFEAKDKAYLQKKELEFMKEADIKFD